MEESPFLRACRRESVPYTPIWLMRQAGRYMPEYRAVRDRFTFLDLCRNPEAAAEVTVTAVEKLGVDAAIIFADILLIVLPLRVGLEFSKGNGPVISRPVRDAADVSGLPEIAPEEDLSYVFEAVRKARAALPSTVPLIGFAGAPFTVASYLIDGHGTRTFARTKTLMYRDPGAWHALMALLARATSKYLNLQIAAGADAVQIFDSWVGCLGPDDYREFVLPHTRDVIRGVSAGTPVIHFGTGTSALLELLREAGGDVIGVDWRVDLATARRRLPGAAVQGNFDPVALFASRAAIERRARAVLDGAGDEPGHVFNLGHGVLPETPVDNVRYLVDLVHELSAR